MFLDELFIALFGAVVVLVLVTWLLTWLAPDPNADKKDDLP
jgi:hypothetical protein